MTVIFAMLLYIKLIRVHVILSQFFQKHIFGCVGAAHTVCVCILMHPIFVTSLPTSFQEFALGSTFYEASRGEYFFSEINIAMQVCW